MTSLQPSDDLFRTPEQRNFHRLLHSHMMAPEAPLLLEGATGLGKTRAYLAAVMARTGQGQRVAIVLPTHQLIDQLLASQDLAVTRRAVTVAAFRPARFFESRVDYEAAKQTAMSADVMLCTAASVIIDHRLGGEYNGATLRDHLLFDEADQLPDMAALQSDFAITAAQLKALGIAASGDARTALEFILRKPPRTVEPEVRAAARVILDALNEPAWYQHGGVDDEGSIVLTHKLPGRLLKKVSNRSNVSFVSATLTIGGRFDDFCAAMGIDKVSHLSTAIEPERHGALTFHIHPLKVETGEWLSAVVVAVNAATKPVLVATSSHDLSEGLGRLLPGATVRQRDETASQAAARCSGVLIAAGAWAGLDTAVRWKSIVVPRIPFDKPVVIEGDVTTSYVDARNTAIRRLRQVIGRGLRTPDAQCSIYIMDDRVDKLSAFVPERFAHAWVERGGVEGQRELKLREEAKRLTASRQRALKAYGCQCMACGHRPLSQSVLDVHHLQPIAEGKRDTMLADLAVLCANCHRLAHTQDPPLTIAALRQWVMADASKQ